MSASGYQSLVCGDQERRARLQGHPLLNGIDYVEFVAEPEGSGGGSLNAYFIPKTTPRGSASLLALLAALDGKTDLVEVRGGVRVKNIEVVEVSARSDHLEVRLSQTGDLSTYELVINGVEQIDPAFSRCAFSFDVDRLSRFDCGPGLEAPSGPRIEPLIDYMAKDYASFRQALVDLIPTLVPGWWERHEADLGTALVELLAYAGDQLSYYQDAVANEAYLHTARQRISVRRHARLIDYRMHDGASACTFVHLGLRPDAAWTLPKGTQLLSGIEVPLGPTVPPHGPVIPAELKEEALAAAEVVFETWDAGSLYGDLNRIPIHTWGNRRCCLPLGTTTVDLVGDLTSKLRRDDFLLFEEVLGSRTGRAADADPGHRQVVRLTGVEPAEDPLLEQPLTRVEWGTADALTFPLCLSAVLDEQGHVPDVSVARGNLVLADHGRTVTEWHPSDPDLPQALGVRTGERPYRFRLREGPLGFRLEPEDRDGSAPSARGLANTDVRRAKAQVGLDVYTTARALEGPGRLTDLPGWRPKQDLLDSDPFEQAFVVETENDGRAVIRFGNDRFGMAPPDGSHVHVTYRVGVGQGGNVGPESLVHVIDAGMGGDWSNVVTVRNPLAAWGGQEAEPMEQVKQLAPFAFRAELLRAVTEEDYALAAEKHPEVSRAVATFRWTGSWYTVSLTIDPVGRTDLPLELERSVRDWVAGYAQAGYDLRLDSPVLVPLQIEVDVWAAPDHFRADVEEALLVALGAQPLPDGGQGFFHPDNFTFGQALYLSQLYRAIEEVSGVDWAQVIMFHRFSQAPAGELEQGYIPMGRLEVVQLENDPSLPESGIIQFNVRGGK
jgi:hypothetical protein